MKLSQKKTSELIPFARNSRTHSAEQVGQIVASIEEFGFTNPLLIDESNGIIAGHGRLMAAKLLKMKEVPCVVLEGLTETQKKAYVIADNKLALNAGWDEDLLGIELHSLIDVGFDVDIMGFSEMELDDLMEEAALDDEIEDDRVIHEQSLQVEPAKEYVLILADSTDEWDEMVAYFGLQKVRKGGYKKGSAFDAISTERVLTFERVKNANSNTE